MALEENRVQANVQISALCHNGSAGLTTQKTLAKGNYHYFHKECGS